MIKKLLGIIIIFITGGALLYLDCLNRQEKNSAEQIRLGLDQLRIEGKRRVAAKEAMTGQKQVTLNQCLAAADKARADYTLVIEQVAPRKKGQPVIPPAATAEAEKIWGAAKAECQHAYETQVKDGK